MLYDSETRALIAREHAALLQTDAAAGIDTRRTRRWLSDRLIAAGLRLAPGAAPAEFHIRHGRVHHA